MGVDSAIKLEVCHQGMLDRVVESMGRFQNSAELQEQACRAINAISKGEEQIKEYLADRQGDLKIIESIIEAMDKFTADEGVVLAGASAVWSVAFKNVRMKNRAGELGAFPTIMDVIRTHSRVARILPHAFVAIGNLSANHAPNQAICGQEGVVELCLELLPMHRRDATIIYTILSCLSAVLAGQSDNVAKFSKLKGLVAVTRIADKIKDPQVQRCARGVEQAIAQDRQAKASRQKERCVPQTIPQPSASIELPRTNDSILARTPMTAGSWLLNMCLKYCQRLNVCRNVSGGGRCRSSAEARRVLWSSGEPLPVRIDSLALDRHCNLGVNSRY
jgi:hypothetical protein